MTLKLNDEVKQFVVFEKDEHQMQQVNVDNYNVLLLLIQLNLLIHHQFEHDAFLLHNDMENDSLPMGNMVLRFSKINKIKL